MHDQNGPGRKWAPGLRMPVHRCTTVLMKSRDGRRLCVACDMFVMTEAEAVALGNTVAGPQPTAGPTAAAAPTAHVPATGISRGSAPVTGSPTIAGRVPAERGGAFAENQLPAAPSRPAPNADDRSARLVTAEHGRGTAAAGSSDSEEAGACADRFATGLPIELRSGPMGDFVSRYRTGFSQRLAPIGAHRIAERSPAASPKRHAGERSQTAADMAEKGDEKHARVNASTDATAVLIAARTTLLDKMLEVRYICWSLMWGFRAKGGSVGTAIAIESPSNLKSAVASLCRHSKLWQERRGRRSKHVRASAMLSWRWDIRQALTCPLLRLSDNWRSAFRPFCSLICGGVRH